MKRGILCSLLLMGLGLLSMRAQTPFTLTFGPYLQDLSAEGVTVIWGTSTDALSWVEMALDSTDHFYAVERPCYFETCLGKRTVGRLHTVRIQGLKPATAYRYRVCSREVTELSPYQVSYGATIATDVYRKKPLVFHTRDPKSTQTSFLMVNDIHEDSDRLADLLSTVKGYDFVFFNGDMVNNMSSEQQLVEGFLRRSTELFAAEKPFFFARGNHETRGLFSDQYLRYFPTSTSEPYYAFTQGPLFVMVLDGGEDKPDSDIEYYGLADFDRYRANQVAWLRQTVESEAFKQAQFRIVVMHVPPFSSSWHGPLEVKKYFVPVLNEAGVDLMLCGHLHSFHYLTPQEADCAFPILINSHESAVGVEVTAQQMQLKVIDRKGKTTREFAFPVKQR